MEKGVFLHRMGFWILLVVVTGLKSGNCWSRRAVFLFWLTLMLLSEMTSLRMVSLPIRACVIVFQGEFARFSTVPARTENRALKPRQMFRVCLQ